MKTPVFVALLLLLGTASCQQNLFNSASSGGALLVLETSGYDGSVGPSATLSSMPYRGSTLENDCSASWYPNGSFCNDAVEIDNPDLSVRTNTHAGSTWSTPLANNPDNIGTMVVDAGSDVTITDFSIFQMFSDGKATHVSISVLNGSGPPVASPNLYQDPNWNVILPTSFIEAGQNLGSGVVSDPTKFTIPSVTGRYFLFEVSNDGTHGFASWIELRHVKAFNLGGAGGDPHIFGLDGSQSELFGDAGDVFNMVTSPELQVNVELIDFEPSRQMFHSFIGAVSFQSSLGSTVVLSFNDAQEPIAIVNGEVVSIADLTTITGEEFTVRKADYARQLSSSMDWHKVAASITVEFPTYSFYVNYVSIPFGPLVGSGSMTFFDFDLGSNTLESAANSHGILGRTASRDHARAMEGTVEDFKVADGLLGSSFAFNRFGI